MTRRDYVFIARVLRKIRGSAGSYITEGRLAYIERAMADEMEAEFAGFNRKKFLAMCRSVKGGHGV